MKKKELWILGGIALIIIAFFWDLASLKHAFLSGDHREQQFPWAKFYQDQIRSFSLPWWTSEIHCGFPILAEGQIGAFYPLNYLFFMLLPLKVAYNYIILFQYWLGAALFYVYLRRLKLSVYAAFFSSLIFLFGSTQGGYFYYNYISQKVVIWLPLTLILIDRLVESRRWQDGFWLGTVFAVQIFGGYLQVAVYSLFYSGVYFLFRWFRSRDRNTFILFAGSCALGIFFSLVQLLPTIELSLLSSRAQAEKGLAYVGSMNPLGFATLFYPSWDCFLGSEFYIGLAGLFFAFLCLLNLKSAEEKFFAGVSVLFLLLALGSYSPLYRLIVETTGFNSFRTPIKFLFFVTFSFSVLAAYGADKFFNGTLAASRLRGAAAVFSVLCAVFLVVPTAGEKILTEKKAEYLPKFQQLVVETYHGKAGHPHSEEQYREKAAGYYDAVLGFLNSGQKDTKNQRILLTILLVFALGIAFRPRGGKIIAGFCVLFLLADLYLYGFTSIKANEEPYDTIGTEPNSGILEYLKSDSDRYRVMEVYRVPDENRTFPVFPSYNMLYGIHDIGAYSPLVMKGYKEFLKGWGYINNSLEIQLVDPEILKARLSDVSFLNVKYLLSAAPLDHPSLELVKKEANVLLYRNKEVLPRAFFYKGSDSPVNLKASDVISATIVEYRNDRVKVLVHAPEPGQVVLSDLYYHGWTAKIGEKDGKMMKTRDLFRKVAVTAGTHEITFSYSTGIYKVMGLTSLVMFLWGCAEIYGARRRSAL